MLSYRLAFAPRWQMLVAYGVLFGLLLSGGQVFAAIALDGGAAVLGYSALVGAVVGLVLGAPLGWLEHRRLGSLRAALDGHAPTGQQFRAASRGPVPAEPHDRWVAQVVVRFTLDEVRRTQVPAAVASSIAAAVGVLFALDGTAWGLLLTVAGLGTIARDIRRVRNLRGRLSVLTACPGRSAGGGPVNPAARRGAPG